VIAGYRKDSFHIRKATSILASVILPDPPRKSSPKGRVKKRYQREIEEMSY